MQIQRSRYLPWLLVSLIVMSAAAVRMRLLDIPLERDEGEYAYTAQLMLQGIPPYKLAFTMKFPGVAGAYAVFMAIFGQTVAGIHLGFAVINAATIVMIFLLGRRLFSAEAGVAASATYALLSVSPGVLGTQAHATHFVVLTALGGMLLSLRAIESGRSSLLFWSGVLYGVAVTMKQHAVLFVAFGVWCLIWDGRTAWASLLKKVPLFLGGVCAPLVLTGLAMWRAGVFDRFWFFTMTYAREYVQERPLRLGLAAFELMFPRAVGANFALWMIALAGLVMVWWRKEDRTQAVFLTTLLVFSFLAICPGLYFREHYFVLMLPAIALLAGSAVRPDRDIWRGASMVLFSAAVLLSIARQGNFLVLMTPLEASRSMYGDSPFAEAIQIGDYIRTHSAGDSKIAVLGSEPEIPFYARRLSASGYIYMYGMMEPQPYALTMQEELIRDLEASRPDYLVVVKVKTSWLRQARSPSRIFEWWDAYWPQHYKIVGASEIDPDLPPDVRWGDMELSRLSPLASVLVYKSTGP